MRNLFLFLTLSTLSLSAGMLAGNPSPATVLISAGGQNQFLTPSLTTRTLGADTVYDFSASSAFQNVAFTITGTLNPDPWLDWTIEVLTLNQTGFTPISVSLSFGTIGGPYNTLTSSFSGTLKDIQGNGGGFTNFSHTPFINLTNQNSLIQGTDCAILGASSANQVHSCGVFGPVSAGVATNATPTLGFTLAGSLVYNDLVTYTGRLTLENQTEGGGPEVPEPTTIILSFGGLATLICIRRRDILARHLWRSKRPTN